MSGNVETGGIGAKWITARTVTGYGAALSLSLYLAVKVVWVVVALFGGAPSNFTDGDWILLNTVTVGMSTVGVALGLVLAWGRRVPAAPLLFCAWVGAGFLVPMIPFMAVSAVLGGGSSDGDSGGGESAPSWELLLIGIGFAGMAIGLAIALPIYMRERWPAAFVGRLGDREPTGQNRSHLRALYILVAALTVLWTYWAAGGTFGLAPSHRDMMDTNGRLLMGNSALWAVIGAAVIRSVTTGRPKIPVWLPMTLGFAASGSLFAWAAWKLPWALLHPGGYAAPEYPAVSVVQYGLSITAGALMLAVLLKATRR